MGRISLIGAVEKFALSDRSGKRRETIGEGRVVRLAGKRATVETNGRQREMLLATDTPYARGSRILYGETANGQGIIVGGH